MKTAVVILNWNTEGFLKEFLPGLIHSADKAGDAEVIVANNASTDGSAALLKKEFPSVRTIAFDRNYGFTGGYNRAFAKVDSEYFVLINSDIEVTEGWLEPLVAWMDSHPECGACAPKLKSWQNREMFEYAGAAGGYIDCFGYPFCRGRVLKKVEKDCGQYDTPADVFWATGACLMVRSEVFRRLGGLDERFFAHMEEIDLCWRMQLHGYRITIVPESVVYHIGGGTLPQTSPFKLFLNYRNNLLMLGNNLAQTYALQYFRRGYSTEKAATEGMRRAGFILRFRMMLDLLSAAVYILTLKTDCFKAVIKAHKEYRKLKKDPDFGEVRAYLDDFGKCADVKGTYGKWIILQSLLYGTGIFTHLHTHNAQSQQPSPTT